jgi:hypothetical protein
LVEDFEATGEAIVVDFVVGTGKPLKVTVNPTGAPGAWPKTHVKSDVYAIGYRGGDTDVLVADDAGRLVWLRPENYSVSSPPARARG